MTTNEAAERLYVIFADDVVLEAEVNKVLDDYAAAERRATVERIRERVQQEWRGTPASRHGLLAILDEEAAR